MATLSGGERTRLAFLLLMPDGANCLVLDEPTNHLDIDSIEVLEGALERYDGTVIAVSHDRYFLDRIADRIVDVSDGSVRAYEGGWSANVARGRVAIGPRRVGSILPMTASDTRQISPSAPGRTRSSAPSRVQGGQPHRLGGGAHLLRRAVDLPRADRAGLDRRPARDPATITAS